MGHTLRGIWKCPPVCSELFPQGARAGSSRFTIHLITAYLWFTAGSMMMREDEEQGNSNSFMNPEEIWLHRKKKLIKTTNTLYSQSVVIPSYWVCGRDSSKAAIVTKHVQGLNSDMLTLCQIYSTINFSAVSALVPRFQMTHTVLPLCV